MLLTIDVKYFDERQEKKPWTICGFTILFVKHCYNGEFYLQKQISPHMLGASFVLFLFVCFWKPINSSVITVSVTMPLKLTVRSALPSMLRSQSV